MKHQVHNLCSKKGQTFELDRSLWSTYANFNHMYSKIVEEMEDAGVAESLPKPVWMDCEGKILGEEHAFGCKVTHWIIYPVNVIVFDELGGNISQKGDGHVGGQLFLCEKEETPQVKVFTRDKQYTVLGLTSLTGHPVMCVIIVHWKET